MTNRHQFDNSSSIRHVDYDDSAGELIICFASGGTYHYPNVGKDVYTSLKEAASPGSHFHKHVKPHYKGVKK